MDVDDETRDALMGLTREVTRLSTLVERSLEDHRDKESRIRKVEKWLYSVPVAYLLTLGTWVTTFARTPGK